MPGPLLGGKALRGERSRLHPTQQDLRVRAMENNRSIIIELGAVVLSAAFTFAACNEDQARPGWEVGAEDFGAKAADGADTSRSGFDGGSDANIVDTGRDAGQDAAAPDRASCGEVVEDWPEASDSYIERSDGRWSRRFSAFRDGCAEYQMLSELDLSADQRHEWKHRTSVAVCNRCDETKSFDFFKSHDGETVQWTEASEITSSTWKQPFRISLRSSSSHAFLQECRSQRGGTTVSRGLTVERARIYSGEEVAFERNGRVYWLHDQVERRPYDSGAPAYEDQMNMVPGYWDNPVEYSKPLELDWWLWRIHDMAEDYSSLLSNDEINGSEPYMWISGVCSWAYYAYGDGEPDLARRKRFFQRYEVGAANFPKPVREYLQDLDEKAPEVE